MRRASMGTRAFAVGISVLMALGGTPVAAIAEEAEPQAVEQAAEGLTDEQPADGQATTDDAVATEESLTGDEALTTGDATTIGDAVATDDATDDAVEVTAGDEVEVTVDGEQAAEQATDGDAALQTQSDGAALQAQAAASVSYRTQIQSIGWQGWRKDGKTSGTSGKSKRLEAIKVKLSGVGGGIQYRTHVQKKGWQGWKADGATSGTVGKGLRLEAIQLRLTGEAASQYDVWYHVHAQKFGWMGWACNGASAGTEGYAYRLEAIEIVVLPKGSAAPGSTDRPFAAKSKYPKKTARTYETEDFKVTVPKAWKGKWKFNGRNARGSYVQYNFSYKNKNYMKNYPSVSVAGGGGALLVCDYRGALPANLRYSTYVGKTSTGKYVYYNDAQGGFFGNLYRHRATVKLK